MYHTHKEKAYRVDCEVIELGSEEVPDEVGLVTGVVLLTGVVIVFETGFEEDPDPELEIGLELDPGFETGDEEETGEEEEGGGETIDCDWEARDEAAEVIAEPKADERAPVIEADAPAAAEELDMSDQ